ncbi:hypothetical protein [Zunongwangia pacifica]
MPENPYWRNNGIIIKDPDEYYIIRNLKAK